MPHYRGKYFAVQIGSKPPTNSLVSLGGVVGLTLIGALCLIMLEDSGIMLNVSPYRLCQNYAGMICTGLIR